MEKADVPWKKINGIRNIIVHNYDTVNTEIVYSTVIYDCPIFKLTLSHGIKEKGK